jgi:hypothetical protein
MPDDPTIREPAAQLVKEAIEEARVLVKLEVALAKNEIKTELTELKTSAVAFGVAAVAALLAISMACLTVVLAMGGRWWVALVASGIWLVLAIVTAIIGFGATPRQPLERTRARLANDLKQLKERVA